MLRNRSLSAVAAGDLAVTLEMAEGALALTSRLDESVLSSWAAMAVACAAVMSGRSACAVEVIGRDDAGEVLHAIPGTGLAALTERERQLAELVADRRTNRRSPSCYSASRPSSRTCATSSASSA